MRIHNVHERTVAMSAEEAGRLLDGLASPNDRLWPAERWPEMRFDRGLVVGARGGHGPIRYEVVGLEPGRRVRFRFREMRGLDGEHGFEIEPAGPGAAVLRHVVDAEARGPIALWWLVVIRPLHDALVEDALDRAQGRAPRPLAPTARALRRGLALRTAAKQRRHIRDRSQVPQLLGVDD
jgi:hypothetical protein